MAQIRQALALAADLGIDLWAGSSSGVLIDATGTIFLRIEDQTLNMNGQPTVLPRKWLNLLEPFETEDHRGPHLVRPRPQIRIAPARLSGEPFIVGTRIATQTIAALVRDGYGTSQVARMYEISDSAINEALDLEMALAA
jgi:uncharacterized protein (DUF433 family)